MSEDEEWSARLCFSGASVRNVEMCAVTPENPLLTGDHIQEFGKHFFKFF